jgi:hypothetical protein
LRQSLHFSPGPISLHCLWLCKKSYFCQGWTTSQYNDGDAKAFKEQLYGLGPLVGGCPWDEQFHKSAIPFEI